jgi:tRNA(Arg) A34 adenosine deaminase TadA
MHAHERFMRRAIELAAQVPELPFGAVIVDEIHGAILAEGWNQTALNPTWHGEIDAMNQLAASRLSIADKKLILYTTAEPCPMCQAAALWTGVETVVFGTSIRTLQRLGWRQIDIQAEEVVRRSPAWNCTIVGGVLEAECDALFAKAIASLRTTF